MRRLGLLLLGCLVIISGCTGTQKGASGGALLGAGIGAIVGHQSGETGKGALIGATVGGLAGALVGDQVIPDDEETTQTAVNQSKQVSEPEPEVVTQRKVKFCPVCGRLYPADMEYCPKDGAKLRWKEE